MYFVQMLFVITDSGQAPDPASVTPLSIVTRPLKDKDVQIYGLGIGQNFPIQELKDIATRSENVFPSVNSVKDLPLRQPTVVKNWKTYMQGGVHICDELFFHQRMV